MENKINQNGEKQYKPVVAWTTTPKCRDCVYHDENARACKLKQCKYIAKR